MQTTLWEFEHAVECDADQFFAWSYWTDVSNWEKLEGEAVDWIRLYGPFALGTNGATKMPGQEPQDWIISELEPERFATIKMPLGEVVFYNRISFDSVSGHKTKITQRMMLEGKEASNLVDGMRMFEQTAPQGLAKLASAIEVAFQMLP